MILAVVGTRPEVIKLGPVVHALRRRHLPVRVAATGQHHDWKMMGCFLERCGIEVDHRLPPGSRDLLGSFLEIAEARLVVPPSIEVMEPVDHDELLARLARARVVVTDSGGVQEEAAIVGTPCVTVRRHTERPETIDAGVGELAGTDTHDIVSTVRTVLARWSSYARPVPHLYGDGRAADKIAQACDDWLAARTADAILSVAR